MIYLGLWLLVLGVSVVQATSITQQTEGWCSPAVGQTGGNVTIICQGVDPKALKRLNELLDKKDLKLQEKIRKAEEWARKYQELFQLLAEVGRDNELAQRLAEEGRDNKLARLTQILLREGNLEEADTLVRQSAISMDQYRAIQAGMSYEEVVKILGRQGVEGARSKNVISYLWQNADGSVVAVVITNGQVGTKTQGGLR